MKEINVLISTIILQIKQSLARPMYRYCLLMNPIINAILIYEMYINRVGDNSDVFISAGLMGIWSCICFSSVGDINRERYNGTLINLFLAPCGFNLVVLGKILGNTILSLVTLVISYITVFVISGTPFIIHAPMRFALNICITIICFTLFSMIIAYLLMLSRKIELYMNLIEIPFVFICGFAFSIEILPRPLQCISYLFAPTWCAKILRTTVIANSVIDMKCYIVLLIELLLMLPLIYLLGLFIGKRVRIYATLEVN